jgi:hypothetical protein
LQPETLPSVPWKIMENALCIFKFHWNRNKSRDFLPGCPLLG